MGRVGPGARAGRAARWPCCRRGQRRQRPASSNIHARLIAFLHQFRKLILRRRRRRRRRRLPRLDRCVVETKTRCEWRTRGVRAHLAIELNESTGDRRLRHRRGRKLISVAGAAAAAASGGAPTVSFALASARCPEIALIMDSSSISVPDDSARIDRLRRTRNSIRRISNCVHRRRMRIKSTACGCHNR